MALARSAFDRLASVACFGVLALALGACSTFAGATRADSGLTAPPRAAAGPPRAVEAALPGDAETASVPTGAADDTIRIVAAAASEAAPVPDAAPSAPPPAAETSPVDEGMAQAREGTEMEPEEYDPWEGWNEGAFEFNRRLDRYVLKPVAKGYNFVVPDEIQIMVSNGFDNISFVPRFVNSLLQGKVGGAGRELSRFLINSTAGVGGLFDPAKDVFGILKSREDFGQTLCTWGTGSGPYVIVPFLEPLTVRDGVGKAVDSAMDPLSYFLPLFWDRLGMKVGDIVNERSLNLDLFQGFEESVIDMYSAVRHAYLQRRIRLCGE
jgi:phospholipid-binding lipoprotein MlaA